MAMVPRESTCLKARYIFSMREQRNMANSPGHDIGCCQWEALK